MPFMIVHIALVLLGTVKTDSCTIITSYCNSKAFPFLFINNHKQTFKIVKNDYI